MTTPYDFEALNKVNKFSHAYKIGSGDITWIDFLKAISLKKKPVLIATGASSYDDVNRAVKTIYKNNKKIGIEMVYIRILKLISKAAMQEASNYGPT